MYYKSISIGPVTTSNVTTTRNVTTMKIGTLRVDHVTLCVDHLTGNVTTNA